MKYRLFLQIAGPVSRRFSWLFQVDPFRLWHHDLPKSAYRWFPVARTLPEDWFLMSCSEFLRPQGQPNQQKRSRDQ
ncbi:Uncharacterised protein [Vibrio cholerae]|nr:Uncharacterised protein [Vibrio cholerae]